MKNIIKTILFVAFIGIASASQSQVVMKEFLNQNHEGMIANSKNNNGKALFYKLEYKSTDGARIYYTLNFYKDASMKSLYISFPVLMRNLTWTYYLDVSMEKEGVTKVFAMIFKKDLRWARVKFSPHADCSYLNPTIWTRYEQVDDYEKLLNNTFTQMDKNVILDCYLK
ncbi:MAG: hypothetical protein KBE86_13250 [Chitinophagales bacterium]|nr:hypothetical protein [Chitinophagales bacterium]